MNEIARLNKLSLTWLLSMGNGSTDELERRFISLPSLFDSVVSCEFTMRNIALATQSRHRDIRISFIKRNLG